MLALQIALGIIVGLGTSFIGVSAYERYNTYKAEAEMYKQYYEEWRDRCYEVRKELEKLKGEK